ncbi:Fanconi anemia group A protein homolog isoform X2 [Uloborus diversus]|uniref:Fanconi anemia group A protein homolog isoform X2 n=1 Tax=Uloborus diversus TaxID=327109 RepID=UPI002409122D|nr:Fanconi anemia group A protein homolog isoform X2 [Uloborus diversus]
MEDQKIKKLFSVEDAIQKFQEIVSQSSRKEYFQNILSPSSQKKSELELAWFLHIFRVMPLDVFIIKFNEQQLLENIRLLFCVWECEEEVFFVQSGILSYIVSNVFEEDMKNARLKQILIPAVETILKETFSAAELEFPTHQLNFFFAIFNAGIVDVQTLSHFCQFSLKYYLSLPDIIEDDEVFRIQSEWKNQFCPPPTLKILLAKMVASTSSAEVQRILLDGLRQDPTHWRNLFHVVDTFLGTGSQLLETVRAMAREAMTEVHGLKKGILLLRQMNIRNNLPFSVSYRQWLQDVLSSLPKQAEAISLLMRVLSDLVPFEENVECLKVAITFPFGLPEECNCLHKDYVDLLKTRIQDLEPRCRPEDDLIRALDTFQETAKIPPFILEMSLFQKQRFQKEFLPVLFMAREQSHQQNVAEKFIQALDRAGKLPIKQLLKSKVKEALT